MITVTVSLWLMAAWRCNLFPPIDFTPDLLRGLLHMGDLVFHSSRQNTSNRHFYYRGKIRSTLGCWAITFIRQNLSRFFSPCVWHFCLHFQCTWWIFITTYLFTNKLDYSLEVLWLLQNKFNATNCTVFNTDTCCTNLHAPFWVFLHVLVTGTELHVVFMHLYRTVMLKSWTSWHSCKWYN